MESGRALVLHYHHNDFLTESQKHVRPVHCLQDHILFSPGGEKKMFLIIILSFIQVEKYSSRIIKKLFTLTSI